MIEQSTDYKDDTESMLAVSARTTDMFHKEYCSIYIYIYTYIYIYCNMPCRTCNIYDCPLYTKNLRTFLLSELLNLLGESGLYHTSNYSTLLAFISEHTLEVEMPDRMSNYLSKNTSRIRS